MTEREIIEELDIEEFKELRNTLGNKILIVKFSAEWCKPCQKIKNFVHEKFAQMPENVVIADIDIDETMDLYMAFRNKKMLKGVPTILAFYGDVKQDDSHWYISDNSISGADETQVESFINTCNEKAKTLL